MPKELSQMTVEELWKLFPIRLTAHKDDWAAWYHEEEKRILFDELLLYNAIAIKSDIASTMGCTHIHP